MRAWLQRFQAWVHRFMAGRYGYDVLSGFLCVSSLILVVIGAYLSPLLYFSGLGLLIFAYYRILSRNISKRYAENLKFLSWCGKAKQWAAQRKLRFAQRKVYRYCRCPHCRQELRFPRGRGRISISCPKCGTQFIKKS